MLRPDEATAATESRKGQPLRNVLLVMPLVELLATLRRHIVPDQDEGMSQQRRVAPATVIERRRPRRRGIAHECGGVLHGHRLLPRRAVNARPEERRGARSAD